MRTCFLPIVYLLLFSLAGSTASYAETSSRGSTASIVVLDILGSADARQDLTDFQASLRRADLEVVQYGQLVTLIRKLEMSPDDTSRPKSIRELSRSLNIDYFLLVDYLKPTRLRITVIEGDTGRDFWAKAFRVSERGLTTNQWDELARRVADKLPQVQQEFDEFMASDDRGERVQAHQNSPTFKIHVGSLAINRNFAASGKKTIDNPLTGGIEYKLGFVPGFAIDAEFAPFSERKSIGFGLGYEQAFFRTKQTAIVPIASPNGGGSTSSTVKLLESGHQRMYARLFYRHRLPSGIELIGGLRGSLFKFTIDGDSEYKGVTYTTLDFELGGQLPLYRESLSLELSCSVSPLVSLGESIEELGSSDTTVGLSAGGGLAFQFESGFSLKGLVAYTNYRSEIQGSGRDGRMIDQTLDQYLSLRVLGGFIY